MISIDRMSDLQEADREALQALSHAVYPPQEMSDWSGQDIEWAGPEWGVRLWNDEGELVTFVGLLLRNVLITQDTLDQRPVRVGGIGGVKTHPHFRGRGYAQKALTRTAELFHEQRNVSFGLLVCDPELLPFYGSLGWREFSGQTWVQQHGERVEFTFNRVMTLGIAESSPEAGIIDLCGPPW